MKVTYQWLKELLPDLTAPAAEVARRLTAAGLEVESVTSLVEGFDKVVVGRLLDVKKHPNADKLTVCQVSTAPGDDPANVRQIVCGATNHKAGDKVAVALPGAVLPNGMKIDKAKMKGEASNGMLCSEQELRIAETSAGIWILPPELKEGENVADAMKLADWTLEIGLTPNRGDCNSVIGLAREVAAAFDLPMRMPLVETEVDPKQTAASKIKVAVDDAAGCPRYIARVIDGVTIGPSPAWMQQRLDRCGVRPINNVVDVTNYVMLEMGQPLHAFDIRFVRGGQIIVRAASEGEKRKALDGVERKLASKPDHDLVIADASGPVALAGVMGGENSGVKDDTKTVVLESAYFDPSRVRKAARRHGLHTESSHRFERSVDPAGTDRASARAAQLIAELGKGKVLSGEVEVSTGDFSPREVRVSMKRVNGLLGITFSDDQAIALLAKIHLGARAVEPGVLSVDVPRFRADISMELDIAEELLRLHGYDKVPDNAPLAALSAQNRSADVERERRAKALLVALGFHETVHLPFAPRDEAAKLKLAAGDARARVVPLANPLADDQAVLRASLIPALLANLARQRAQKNLDVRVFELRAAFQWKKTGELPDEPRRLTAVLSGRRDPQGWSRPADPVDFFDAKGAVEALVAALTRKTAQFAPSTETFLVAGAQASSTLSGKPLGVVGEVHPKVLAAFGVSATRAFLFDLDFDLLSKEAGGSPAFAELPRYPSVDRDVALLVDESTEVGAMLAFARSTAKKSLESVDVFDVFRGGKLPAGKKSVALGMVWRSSEKTLTDEEVNALHEKLVQALEDRFRASRRS